MATIQEEFRARMERDMARFMRHAEQSGWDVRELDGEIVLAVSAGQLGGIKLPGKPRMDVGEDRPENWMAANDDPDTIENLKKKGGVNNPPRPKPRTHD